MLALLAECSTAPQNHKAVETRLKQPLLSVCAAGPLERKVGGRMVLDRQRHYSEPFRAAAPACCFYPVGHRFSHHCGLYLEKISNRRQKPPSPVAVTWPALRQRPC
jgi:hypothetical protein